MAIDFTRADGQVRLLVSDVDETNQVLTDPMVLGFLARYGLKADSPITPRGGISRAAADALDTIATSESLVLKYIRTGDGLTTDGPKVAAELRTRAKSLRDQADRDDAEDGVTGGWFDVVEFEPYPWDGIEAAEHALD